MSKGQRIKSGSAFQCASRTSGVCARHCARVIPASESAMKPGSPCLRSTLAAGPVIVAQTCVVYAFHATFYSILHAFSLIAAAFVSLPDSQRLLLRQMFVLAESS